MRVAFLLFGLGRFEGAGARMGLLVEVRRIERDGFIDDKQVADTGAIILRVLSRHVKLENAEAMCVTDNQ